MMGEINKTDRLDVRGLNRLQQAGTLPRVWIPPGGLRDQRDLPRTRMVLVGQRTQLKNRIHATLCAALSDMVPRPPLYTRFRPGPGPDPKSGANYNANTRGEGRDSLSGGHSCSRNAFRDLVSASVPPLAAGTPVRLAATMRGLLAASLRSLPYASAVLSMSIACCTAARVAGVFASGFSITKSWIVSL